MSRVICSSFASLNAAAWFCCHYLLFLLNFNFAAVQRPGGSTRLRQHPVPPRRKELQLSRYGTGTEHSCIPVHLDQTDCRSSPPPCVNLNTALFTVDHQFNVKIADLELGFMTGQDGGLSAYDVSWRDPYADNPTEEPLLSAAEGGRGGKLSLAARRRLDPDSVNVNELLANWLAPEVTPFLQPELAIL